MIISKNRLDLDRTFVLSSQSLSRAKSCENRAPATHLEHISVVLARISATLDRQPLGKLSEQGGGHQHESSPQKNEIAPPLVTTSYPEGGVAQAERSVLSHRGTIYHGR
jgi:hypothetical protein